MTRAMTIENETHWKTSDIQRIVRAAVEQAGADPKRPRLIRVRWQERGSRVSYMVSAQGAPDDQTKVLICLPRKGPKVLHHNALIALAAAGIETSTPMLAVSDSYFLANALAYEFAKEARVTGFSQDTTKEDELYAQKRATCPPPWADATTLIITKYADPTKDGSYLAFKERKTAEIEAAEGRIHKWEAELTRVQRNLDRARRDKKKAQDALNAAKKRRASQ